MTAETLPLAEITYRGFQALTRELGPVGAARFVAQFSVGSGDYSRDRETLMEGKSVSELAAEIREVVGGIGSANKAVTK